MKYGLCKYLLNSETIIAPLTKVVSTCGKIL